MGRKVESEKSKVERVVFGDWFLGIGSWGFLRDTK
jgi:hypothetical protein